MANRGVLGSGVPETARLLTHRLRHLPDLVGVRMLHFFSHVDRSWEG